MVALISSVPPALDASPGRETIDLKTPLPAKPEHPGRGSLWGLCAEGLKAPTKILVFPNLPARHPEKLYENTGSANADGDPKHHPSRQNNQSTHTAPLFGHFFDSNNFDIFMSIVKIILTLCKACFTISIGEYYENFYKKNLP